MIAYCSFDILTYIYTPNRTYWIENEHKKLGWESRIPRDFDRGRLSNVPDTLVNMLYGLPEDLRR